MTAIPTITEVNCETGETVTRPYNQQELEQHERDLQNWAQRKAEEEESEQIKAAAKASAEAKLAALGLTPEEIAALR
jgi:hypothetical protein